MAYQPKSYRKFLATSVTAAMVATVAAPFATPAQAAANFPDVPASHWASDAIDYLVEKGALEGRPNGSFDPTASITRGEAAKILAITLGLEVDLNAKTDFADAANHWASPYIAAIQAQTEDVINGYENGTFRPNNNITRQEMAKMVVTAYGLELDAEADVEFNDNNGWGAEFVNVLASLGIVEGMSEGSFNPNGLVTRAQTPVFVQRTEVPEVRVEVPTKEPVVEVPAELAVESVSANNLKTVNVVFNAEVDKVSAETVANYSLKNGTTVVDLASAKVQADGKSVVLTLTNDANQQDAVSLEVKDVKSVDGTVAPTVTKSFTFFDTVAPTVEQTRLVGPRKVEVTFSEPLEVAPTVKLNNGSISSTVTLNGADRSKAIVEFGLEPALGNHSLEIEGGADYAGFKVEKVTETFTYAKDETAPTVVVDKAAPGSVTLKFSKPVAVKSAANVSVYHTINNSGAYVGSALTPVNAVDGFADTFTVTFATPLAEGSSKVFLNTAANALEDEWGNDVASAELTASVVIDKVAPQVTSLTASTDKKIEVQFSKEVKVADAQLAANYVLTDSEGKAVSLAGATFVYDNAKKVTTITLPSNLKAGNYSLTVKNITDTTFAENKLTSQTVSVAVPDTTAWDITPNAVQSGNNIRVTFNEAMSSEGLTSLSNYSLRKADGSVIAFPTNSSVVVVNSTTVELRLGAAVADLNNIRVSGSLKDAAGNIFSNTDYKTATVVPDVIDASSIEADSVKTTSKNTLQFKVNQELQGSLTPAHFTLSTGDVVAGASYVNNEGKATVTLTLRSADEFAPNDTAALTIAASALKNTFGTVNAAEIAPVAVADGIAPTVTKTGTTLDINDNPATAATDFTINFDENLAASTALWSSDLVIKDADGKTLKAGDDFEVTSSANVATVTLVGAYVDYAGSLNVASIATPAYIRDAANNTANAFAATTITVTSEDTVAPTVTTALGDGLADGETLAIGDHVVEFSEALNAASKTAVQDAFVAGNGEATAELTFAWTNDSTLTITVATAAATYAADVTDLAGNTTTGAVALAH